MEIFKNIQIIINQLTTSKKKKKNNDIKSFPRI